MEYNFCPTCKSQLHLGNGGYIACVNEACNFVYYENPTPVVAAVIEYRDGNVLLAHNSQWPPNIFALVTGFLEKHEDPEEAVLREVKEEVGLDAEIRGFLGHYMFKKRNQLLIAYHVYADGEVILNDPEIDEVKIVPFEKVKTWPAGTGMALKKFLENKGYTPEVVPFP
jgi:NADH pyrophosphatase NudC (nudix superfamily)